MIDCHCDGSRVPPKGTVLYKVTNVHVFFVSDTSIKSGYNLSGKVKVQHHILAGTIVGSVAPYSCDFDKYVVVDTYAVVLTLELPGSFWFLADQTAKTHIITTLLILLLAVSICT